MEIFKLFGSIFVNTDEAEKSMAKTEKGAESVAAKLGNGVQKAAKWGAAIVAAAGTIAVAIGTKAVSAASEFETSFAKVNTLLADTTDLDSYKKAIIDLSNKTGVATNELCESIYSAISASVDQADAIDFVASALKLAEGGFTDAATAVDVMTTAINAYGLSAEDATQVSDYLITTQNLGKTSVGELASSLGKVIPIAAAYGVKMDDLCANTALLTKNGIATAEAITYTKAMLNELGDSGSVVGGILKEKTGQSFAELEASGMSLGDIIAILGESVDGDTSAFNELWSSSEAGVGALTLLKTGAEEYNSTLEEMRDSAGATEDAYTKMHDTFSVKVEQLKTVVTNTLAEIGGTLLPFANNVLDWVIGNMPVIQEAIQSVIDDVIPVIQQFADLIVESMPMIQESLGALVPVLVDMASTFLPVMAELAGALLPVIVELISSLLPVIAEMASAILPILVSLMEAMLPPLMEILQTALPPLVSVIEALMPLLATVIQLLAPILELFVGLLEPIVSLVVSAIMPLVEIIISLIDMALKPLIPVVEAVAKLLEGTLGAAFEGLSDVIDGIMQALGGLIDFVAGVFTGDWERAWNGVVDIFAGIFTGIVAWFKTPINAIISGINSVFESIGKIKVPDWVPIIGGASFSLPQIPLLAKGGTVVEGGKAIVGEKGPELLDLPAGAKVTPLDRSDAGGTEIDYDMLLKAIVEAIRIAAPELERIFQIVPDESGIFRIVRKKAVEYRDTTGKEAFV